MPGFMSQCLPSAILVYWRSILTLFSPNRYKLHRTGHNKNMNDGCAGTTTLQRWRYSVFVTCPYWVSFPTYFFMSQDTTLNHMLELPSHLWCGTADNLFIRFLWLQLLKLFHKPPRNWMQCSLQTSSFHTSYENPILTKAHISCGK
jgi:hypothetical protein